MPFPYSLDDYVSDVKEELLKRGIEKPCVVAHSFGARIVLRLASLDSEFFDKIVLTGAAGLKPKLTFKKAVKRTVFKVLKPFIKKEKLLKFYSKDYLALSNVMRKSFIKIVNNNLDEDSKKIKNPTLLVFGKEDKETPLYMAKRLNKNITNSTLIVIEKAGHFAFIDKPSKFNMEVKEFLLR